MPPAAPVTAYAATALMPMVSAMTPGCNPATTLKREMVAQLGGDLKAALAAYDGAIQAASGMMAITGHPDTGPMRTGYMPVDMATALNAAFAISAA